MAGVAHEGAVTQDWPTVPSPLGHMMGGLAAGWLVAGRCRERWRPSSNPRLLPTAWTFALAGAAPDLDLLVGAHSMYTHSVGAVAIAGVLVLVLTRGRERAIATGVAAAVASHILLDWLGSDTSAPIGIMALWPFTHEFYQSPFNVFAAISRRYWLPEFLSGNLIAAVRECAILLPVLVLVGWWRRCHATRPGLKPRPHADQ